MMETVGDIYSKFTSQLSKSYKPGEAEQITILAFEHTMNYRRFEISLNKDEKLNQAMLHSFDKILSSLRSGKPIQYVLGNSWFYGIKLVVNKHVLIPRRETEELVNWIIKDIQSSGTVPSVIVDICTGSGCIALALKKEFQDINIIAVDNSEKALEVARYNAIKENLKIEFKQMDALKLDMNIEPGVIVCNPPYVLNSEKENMHLRVKEYEPSSALFVPDDDSLVFYRHVAEWGRRNMKAGGSIYFEINERMGIEITALLSQMGFTDVVVKKDFQEKDRMLRAMKT